MQTKITDIPTEPPFSPFKIEINVETVEDAKTLYRIFNHAFLIQANPNMRNLANAIQNAIASHSKGSGLNLNEDFGAFHNTLREIFKNIK